jgi:hypothetical protein
VAVGRVYAAQDLLKMIADQAVATTGARLQFRPPGNQNAAAPRLEHGVLPQPPHDAAHIASADAEKTSHLLLRQGHLLLAGSIEGRRLEDVLFKLSS